MTERERKDIQDRMENLVKYEWVFEQYLRTASCQLGTMGEINELNEHHRALFGNYENTNCNDCRAVMITNLATWYFQKKKLLQDNA